MSDNTSGSTQHDSTRPAPSTRSGRGLAATAGLVVGAVLAVVLVVFIVQNGQDVAPDFFTLTLPTLALGVYLLLAAAVGFVLALLVGGARKVVKKR